MTPTLDHTHNASTQSWLASANAAGCEFPIQNLPFGRFKRVGDAHWRIGTAIGDQVLDIKAAGLIQHADMAQLLALSPDERTCLRHAIFNGLAKGRALQAAFTKALVPQAGLTLGLPCDIGDYTDFYTSIHHATTVGKQFRPDQPLLPNYEWVPIGYHGRASSVVASGTAFYRPRGQTKPPHETSPSLITSKRLDYELELGVIVGQGNALGQPIAIEHAMAHVFGLALFNDWSARDVQGWEYQPLGPFLAKNFLSTLSPWIITMEALAPFHDPFTRASNHPQPLPYLSSAANSASGALDINLEVWLQTEQMAASGHAGDLLSESNYKDAFWTIAQLVAHHTVNGCNLRSGDLLGTGTLSGPAPEQGGSLLELSNGGKTPLTLSNGELRAFLQDGDTVILRGFCQRQGFARIGLGHCSGTVLPARA